MGKYLHLFESPSDFQEAYYDDGGPASFVCSGGTFVYDRHEIKYEEDYVDEFYVWKNGDKVLITWGRIAKVGPYNYENGTGAWDGVNQNEVEITAVGETIPGEYHEPWVSLTHGLDITMFSAKLNNTGETQTYRYVGECWIEIYK